MTTSTTKIERAEDHRSITCSRCGASGADQYRHDTGRMMGWGRFELHCRCGHVTPYDVGCSAVIHARMKAADIDTFLSTTIYAEYRGFRIWAVCPWCGSTMMRTVKLDILPPETRDLVIAVEADAA